MCLRANSLFVFPTDCKHLVARNQCFFPKAVVSSCSHLPRVNTEVSQKRHSAPFRAPSAPSPAPPTPVAGRFERGLHSASSSPGLLGESGRNPRLQWPYRLAEAAPPPRRRSQLNGPTRGHWTGASRGGGGHCPLRCPPRPPHLARWLARASANRVDPTSLARTRALYVAGGGRREAGARKKKSPFAPPYCAWTHQDACARLRAGWVPAASVPAASAEDSLLSRWMMGCRKRELRRFTHARGVTRNFRFSRKHVFPFLANGRGVVGCSRLFESRLQVDVCPTLSGFCRCC
ncbi:uncharacterized protein LOC116273872 [Papio anubis]|uniref:uncharacterized protein LOC116273872 n=1 Tax=Papio anubis TaxID=9555 RepID=UPI0012AD6FC9|nr:uncharacterized protein LOC116273872 [Papio anubis]